MTTTSFERAIFFLLVSTFCLSLFGLFTKLALSIPSIPLVLFFRFVLPLLIFTAVVASLGKLRKLWPMGEPLNQMLRAISTFVTQFCFLHYLQYATLLDASMLLYTGPVFIPFFSRWLFGRHFPRITWLTTGLALLGVAFILKPTKGIFDLHSLYGLMSGIALAFSQIFYGINAEKQGHEQNLFYLFFLTSCFSFVFLWFSIEEGHKEIFVLGEELFFSEWRIGLCIVALSLATLGNQFFRWLAYRRSSPIRLAPFLYAAVLFSAGWDWLIFHRPPDLYSLLGAVFVIGSSLIQWHFTGKQLDA